MKTRTRRQKEVLDFITRYIENHGYDPSYQVIARHLGVNSKAGIAKHVAALEEQGFLERRRADGSFKLYVRGPSSGQPACEIDWITTDGEPEEWEEKPLTLPRCFLGNVEPSDVFAFRMQDDAMTDKHIAAGDVVLVERRPYVRDGACAAVSAENVGTLLRCFFRSGAHIELRPANSDFEDLRLPADKVEVLGIVRGLIRPID